jgi:hypothetical protein
MPFPFRKGYITGWVRRKGRPEETLGPLRLSSGDGRKKRRRPPRWDQRGGRETANAGYASRTATISIDLGSTITISSPTMK